MTVTVKSLGSVFLSAARLTGLTQRAWAGVDRRVSGPLHETPTATIGGPLHSSGRLCKITAESLAEPLGAVPEGRSTNA